MARGTKEHFNFAELSKCTISLAVVTFLHMSIAHTLPVARVVTCMLITKVQNTFHNQKFLQSTRNSQTNSQIKLTSRGK